VDTGVCQCEDAIVLRLTSGLGNRAAAVRVILGAVAEKWSEIGVCFLVILVAGCSSGGGKQSKVTASTIPKAPLTRAGRVVESTRHFGGKAYGVSFDYPATWHEAPYTDISGSLGSPLVFLSNATLHAPCIHTSPRPGVTSITCGYPIKALARGQFLVTWSIYAHMGDGPQLAHPNTTINGTPAEVRAGIPRGCGRIHGQEILIATLARDKFHYVEMVACARAPGLAATEALVRRMLRSVHVTS
jgi:hypothetical protein